MKRETHTFLGKIPRALCAASNCVITRWLVTHFPTSLSYLRVTGEKVPMTARYARRVVLMSIDGRLVETGDPKTLMENEDSSLYALIHKVKRNLGASCWCCLHGGVLLLR